MVFLVIKACVGYFSLFMKEQCISRLFQMKYFKENLTYSCLILPLFYEHLFCPQLPRAAHPLKSSNFGKITACLIETILLT